MIAAQLKDVGIDVEVTPFEFPTFFSMVKKGTYQLASMQTAEITEPDWLFTYFNSERIPGPKNPDDNNRWRYRNAWVDALTLAGRTELDPAVRKAIYALVQRTLADDLPIVPLWHEDTIVVANQTVHGYAIMPDTRLAGLVTTTKDP